MAPGLRIGLLGGSFNPAHDGHVYISAVARARLRLDQVWWLVSPQNPLKARDGMKPLAERMRLARALGLPHFIRVTDLESRLGTTFTADTLGRLHGRYPGQHFVWLMGADNLAQFDQWKDWRQIMETSPIGIIARPDARLSPLSSRAARIYRGARVPTKQSRVLGRLSGPAWCYMNMPLMPISSTALRSGA